MTIKFEKEIKIDGEIWYRIWAGGICIKCTQDMEIAKKYYSDTIENTKNGLPRLETIAQEEVPNL